MEKHLSGNYRQLKIPRWVLTADHRALTRYFYWQKAILKPGQSHFYQTLGEGQFNIQGIYQLPLKNCLSNSLVLLVKSSRQNAILRTCPQHIVHSLHNIANQAAARRVLIYVENNIKKFHSSDTRCTARLNASSQTRFIFYFGQRPSFWFTRYGDERKSWYLDWWFHWFLHEPYAKNTGQGTNDQNLPG